MAAPGRQRAHRTCLPRTLGSGWSLQRAFRDRNRRVFEPKLAERYGVEPPDRHVLLDSLAQHGLKHEDIDFVILSHLHFDHAGGLLPSYQEMQTGNTELLFSKARYIVGADAWNRATNPHPRDRASYVGSIAEKLQASKRLDIVQRYQTSIPDQSDLPFEFLYSDGHTPGQMHTLVRGPPTASFFVAMPFPVDTGCTPPSPWATIVSQSFSSTRKRS